MKKTSYIIVVTLLTFTLMGCSQEIEAPKPTVYETISPTKSVSFFDSSMRINSKITDTSVSPSRVINICVDVDESGNGGGALYMGDLQYNLSVFGDILYLIVDESTVIEVLDISGHMLPADIDLHNLKDFVSEGFTVSANKPRSFRKMIGNLDVYTEFSDYVSNNPYDFVNPSIACSLEEAITYVLDYNAEDTNSDNPTDSTVVDFYNMSDFGVIIDGKIYSIGDTCNPSTYFDGNTPEGILKSYSYNQDRRIDYTHVSYLTNTGKVVFVTNSNYVNSIKVTGDFEFIGITNGVRAESFKKMLGEGLSKKDRETFVPIHEDLLFVEYSNNTYYCTLRNLNVEFRFKSYVLSELYIEQNLNYRG